MMFKKIIVANLSLISIMGLMVTMSNPSLSPLVGTTPSYSIEMNSANAISQSDRQPSPVTRTKSFSVKNWGGLNTSSYATTGTVNAELSNVGVNLTLKNFIASSGQVKGNDDVANNFIMFNTVAFPGAISGISLKVTGGTITGTSTGRNLLVVGNSNQENIITNNLNINEIGNTGLSSISWTVDPTLNYTFFKIYHLATSLSAVAGAADAITITYEDYSLTKSYKTVDMNYHNVYPLASTHVQIGSTLSGNTGRIFNDSTTQITSITSVLAIFTFSTASGGSFTLYTGSTSEPTTNAVTLTSNNEAMISGNPYFFMVKNTGTNNVYLESLVINYSCIPNEGLSSSSQTSSSAVTSTSSISYAYTGYYASIQGLEDNQLISTLRSKLRLALTTDGTYGAERLVVNYDDAGSGEMLFATDRDPNNANNVIILYSNASVPGTWDQGATYNREHVFPQSLMGVDTSGSSRHKGADLHNLKPANPSQNSSRSNSYYSETFISGTTYVPPANVRGDLARILFYMITMYPELSLVDVTSGDPAVYSMAQFTLMVKWHLEDPVDAFESNRNDVIYGFQNNRNPYIDHEELVCRIWGPSNATTQSYCAA